MQVTKHLASLDHSDPSCVAYPLILEYNTARCDILIVRASSSTLHFTSQVMTGQRPGELHGLVLLSGMMRLDDRTMHPLKPGSTGAIDAMLPWTNSLLQSAGPSMYLMGGKEPADTVEHCHINNWCR